MVSHGLSCALMVSHVLSCVLMFYTLTKCESTVGGVGLPSPSAPTYLSVWWGHPAQLPPTTCLGLSSPIVWWGYPAQLLPTNYTVLSSPVV